MMQKDKVQKWVNSLPVDGEVISENNAADDGLISHSSINNRITDDMFLGAEAKSVLLTGGGREQSSVEGLDRDAELANSVAEPSAKFRIMGGTCNGSGDAAVQLLRQRFRIHQQDSFNSESSSHLTVDSIDQLLWERRGDPEKILENLGFVGKIVDRRLRIPERFLTNSSKANGISVEQFLEKNPWLKDYLEQRAALRKPFEAITQRPNSVEECTEIEPEVENTVAKKMTAFHQVASTVTMIARFRGLVQRLNAREPELEPLVEPILRNSSKGTKYWSILTIDNYNFLDQMGYYELHIEKPSKVKSGRSRFNLAVNLVKQMSGNGLANLTQEGNVSNHSDNELRTKQSEKLDKILRQRTSVVACPGKDAAEKVPEKVESPLLKDTRFSVPERFLTSQSLLLGSVQQLTGESVSELVRKSGDDSYNLSSAPGLRIAPSDSAALTDLNANTIKGIPEISVDSLRESVSSESNAVESFEYEWQRTSISSTGTEDSFSDSDGRIFFFDDSDNPRMDLLGLTVDDVGRGLLRVPSDAASNLSSNTLRERDDVDHSSDQDTLTDTLQMSHDSLHKFRNVAEFDQMNSLEESSGQRDGLSSQLNKKTDISSDHLTRVFNFPSKIRGVLRRQGSSQSDSSGFIDSDHLDSVLLPDSHFSNKVRYMNRQMKLDTISSQDSTSLEEDSNFSSQSDLFHSPHSVFSPSSNQNFGNSSSNRLRILKGDYRNEFWSTKHSVETQTGWESFYNSADDLSTLSHKQAKERRESLMKAKFLSQPEIYTTRLYIDSLLPRTSVPLVERTEVMLILDGNKSLSRSRADDEDSRLQSVYHVSSVDLEVTKTKDADQFLTPILFSSGKTATVKNQAHADEPRHKRRRNSLPLDFSDHQILHSLLKQSVFVSPQCAASLLPPSQWATFGDVEISHKQHLLEEVKLLQHALQKYRLEVRVLQMQAKKLYLNEGSCILSEERDSLLALEELNEAISKELDSLDAQLSQRMKLVISVSPDDLSIGVDLSCLSIIKQMTELLKEQINHGNIINGMSIILPSSRHSASGVVSYAKGSEEDRLLEKISSLEKKMEEQSNAFEKFLSNAMQQMQDVMLQQRSMMLTESSTSRQDLSRTNAKDLI